MTGAEISVPEINLRQDNRSEFIINKNIAEVSSDEYRDFLTVHANSDPLLKADLENSKLFDICTRPGAKHFLVMDGDKVIAGTILLIRDKSSPLGPGAASVSTYVEPNYRSRGIATQLLRIKEDMARAAQMPYIELVNEPTDPTHKAIMADHYKKLGYRELSADYWRKELL